MDLRLAIEVGTIIFMAGGFYFYMKVQTKRHGEDITELKEKVDKLEDSKVDKGTCGDVASAIKADMKEFRSDLKELIKAVFRMEGKIDKNNGHS